MAKLTQSLHGCIYAGAAILSMFYEGVQRTVGAVGVHLAVSTISRGKSNCAKIALAMAGNFPKGYAIYMTDSMARSFLSGALPFVYDDPSDDRVLKPLLMNSFGGAEIGTQRTQFSARCSPIVTANEFVVEQLMRSDKRFACEMKVPFFRNMHSYPSIYSICICMVY